MSRIRAAVAPPCAWPVYGGGPSSSGHAGIGSTNSISGSIPTVAKTRRVAELKKVRASSWSARAAASAAYAVFMAVQQARHRRWSPSASR